MKKISVILCVVVFMLSFSVVVFAEANDISETASISASSSGVYIIPADNETVHHAHVVRGIDVPCGFTASITVTDYAAVDKYTPEIMEQINIISVAPRE